MSMADTQRPEPHAISDSEPEVQVVGKRKKTPRKTKMSATPDATGSLGHATPTPGPSLTSAPATLPVSQDSGDMSEMRAMFREMKTLTEKNSVFVEMLAKAEELRQETSVQLPYAQRELDGETEYTDYPNLDDVSHEQVVTTEQGVVAPSQTTFPLFADYGWETEEEGLVDEETVENPLLLLQTAMSRPPAVGGGAAPAAAGSAQAGLGRGAGQVLPLPAPVVNTSGATDPATTGLAERRRVFKLADNLCEGSLHTELQELYKKIRKPVKERIHLDENLAGAMAHFYLYAKPKKAINELARQYTGVLMVPESRVQALNEEIHFIEGRKLAEEALFWASKGVVAAMTAIAPALALVLARGKKDAELDAQAKPLLDAVKVLVHTHAQITVDRIANVGKVVNTTLGKEVIKRKTDKYGEKELPTEHLLGEDLADKNKKVIKVARASDTVMNTSLAPKKWRKSGDYYRPAQTIRRARGFRGGRGGQLRSAPYQPWNSRGGTQAGRYNKSADYGSTPSYQPAHRGARGRGTTSSRGFQK